jgi:hypothetical protein
MAFVLDETDEGLRNSYIDWASWVRNLSMTGVEVEVRKAARLS